MDTRKITVKRIIRLDGKAMKNRADTHNYLKARFEFPDYYGNNLDALYDLLTESGQPRKIILYHVDALKRSQPDYGRSILKVFRAAEAASSRLEILFYDGIQEVPYEYRIRFEPDDVEILDDALDYEPLYELEE